MGFFNTTCPIPAAAADYGKRGSGWHSMVYIALASCFLTLVISTSLMVQHLRRYRAPKEQRQILRIVFSVVVYSIVAFFELYSYAIAIYIDPLGDLYEAFGLCALFLLFIQYAAPTNKFNDDTLSAARAASEKDPGFDWVRISWVFVFQYPVVELLCVLIQEASQATGHYCLQSLDPQFAHLWLEIVESISIGACVLAIVKFYTKMKTTMSARRGLSKILSFKIIVGLRFFQAWVFSTLLQHNVIKVSKTFSYNDILYGIPAVLICVEMVFFACGFWYAFSSTEYSSRAKPGMEPRPILSAILHAINPSDLVIGFVRVIPFSVQLSRSGDWRAWRIAYVNSGLIGFVRQRINRRRNRKNQASADTHDAYDSGRYQEVNQSGAALPRPPQMHHGHTDSGASQSGEYPLSGFSPRSNDVYQPPNDSPPMYDDEERTGYLMADTTPSGRRSRSTSGGYLRVDHTSGAVPPPPTGSWNGQRYDRSPSPDARFDPAPTRGRDMV